MQGKRWQYIKHSKENLIDVDSDESEQVIEYDTLQQAEKLNPLEYIDQ